MLYKTAITDAMTELGRDPKRVFIGYNMQNPSFIGVPAEQIIETPVAENLMLSMAIGMALDGFKPLVWFERFDFIMNAMDALVNHLCKIKGLSKGEFDPAVIIRCQVGGTKMPFFTGPTHTQDFTDVMCKLVDFPVVEFMPGVYETDSSLMVVEYKDKYSEQV